jgi:broad specificity phosphatase PhoE
VVDVFLFRHSHVDYTPPIPITAHNPLTPIGHVLAERLAERCDAWTLQHLFVSTMLRTRQTADALSRRFPALPRTELAAFEETSFTDLEGFPGPLPEEGMNTWEDKHHAYTNPRMWARVQRGWEQVQAMVAEQGLERVAIVSHGGPINALIRLFMGGDVVRPSTCWLNLDWASTSCLRYTSERRSVRWVNDARHLDGLRDQLG